MSGSRPEPQLILLGVAYSAFAALSGFWRRAADSPWRAYPLVVIDVLAVTAFIALIPDTPLPLWTLLLFPLLVAGLTGRGLAFLALVLSLVSYGGLLWQAPNAFSPVTVWPPAVLVAALVTVRVFAARWLARAHELAREHLQAQEQRLRASWEGLPAPAALWDADGNLIEANAAHRALLPEGGSCPPGGQGGELVVGEPQRVFVVEAAPLAGGRYLLSLYREVTQEREALRAKDELIALVGHELRTPLTAIYGYSQMMARHLAVVQEQVQQVNRLIGDLTDTSWSGDGQLSLAHEPVNLAEVAAAAAERFRGSCQSRELRLEVSDVPSVLGDRARLGQVLDNLLNNAAKYSPDGSKIVLTLTREGSDVIVFVEDRGAGIAPEHIPHVFDRLYRVSGPETRRAKGLGLGLSIVKEIVTAHGGRVSVESEGQGRGSTFRVSLPAASGER